MTRSPEDAAAWRAAQDALAELAARHDATLFDVSDGHLVLSANHSSQSIVVSGAADGDVAVRTGLSIAAWLTYLPEDDVRPVALVYFVEAVLDGGAREGAVLDAAGNWVGTTWEVTSRWGKWGPVPWADDERVAWRSLPRWSPGTAP